MQAPVFHKSYASANKVTENTPFTHRTKIGANLSILGTTTIYLIFKAAKPRVETHTATSLKDVFSRRIHQPVCKSLDLIAHAQGAHEVRITNT